jgi:hypothetical protein
MKRKRGEYPRTIIPPMQRLYAKVVIDPATGCHLWQGHIGKDGYGRFSLSRFQKSVATHRWTFEQANGPIPPGLVIDHLCRVRHCVNPAHMESVTNTENLLRGDGAAAKNARKTHCKRGHPLEGDNLVSVCTPTGVARQCRICRGLRSRINGLRRQARNAERRAQATQ